MFRSLLRSSHILSKNNLLKQIEENINIFKQKDVSDIQDYFETFKEYGFIININKKSNNILLSKNTEKGNLKVLFKATPPEKIGKNTAQLFNPKNLKEITMIIEASKKKGLKHIPVPFRVVLEKGDFAEVFECLYAVNDFSVRTSYLVEKDWVKIDDRDLGKYYFRPFLFYEDRNNLSKNFRALLKTIGVDEVLISGMCRVSDFHYSFLCDQWVEKINKLLSK